VDEWTWSKADAIHETLEIVLVRRDVTPAERDVTRSASDCHTAPADPVALHNWIAAGERGVEQFARSARVLDLEREPFAHRSIRAGHVRVQVRGECRLGAEQRGE
jgi:hypothetical protein